MERAFVGARADRALRGDHADAARGARARPSTGAGLDDADDGYVELVAEVIEGDGAHRVARDDEHFDVVGDEPRRARSCVADDGIRAPSTVRYAGRVPEVDEILR